MCRSLNEVEENKLGVCQLADNSKVEVSYIPSIKIFIDTFKTTCLFDNARDNISQFHLNVTSYNPVTTKPTHSTFSGLYHSFVLLLFVCSVFLKGGLPPVPSL